MLLICIHLYNFAGKKPNRNSFHESKKIIVSINSFAYLQFKRKFSTFTTHPALSRPLLTFSLAPRRISSTSKSWKFIAFPFPDLIIFVKQFLYALVLFRYAYEHESRNSKFCSVCGTRRGRGPDQQGDTLKPYP